MRPPPQFSHYRADKDPMTAVTIEELRDQLSRRLGATRLSDEDATAIVAYIVDAEACGRHTHGVQRIVPLLAQLNELSHVPRLTTRRVSSGVWAIDADCAPGIVAAQRAIDTIISAPTPRPAIVAATGFVGTTGALGYFATQAARAGYVCAAMTCCEAGVAPTGGIDPVLGTNPLAVSFPVSDEQVTIDISTAAVSYGALQMLARLGQPAPPDTVIDHDGSPSTDPRAADTGAQLPMAGHKGYGLGLLIELLTGPMIGAKAGRFAVPGGDGLVVIASPVDLFRSAGVVADDAVRLLAEVRRSRPADSDRPVRIPGERSDTARKDAYRTGEVDVDAEVWQHFLAQPNDGA
jgi:LDH2 family malate/lactate/ureidoglycolate dehydrogenase